MTTKDKTLRKTRMRLRRSAYQLQRIGGDPALVGFLLNLAGRIKEESRKSEKEEWLGFTDGENDMTQEKRSR